MQITAYQSNDVELKFARVLALAEFSVLDGEFEFIGSEPPERSSGSVRPSASSALALVRDGDGWSALVPAKSKLCRDRCFKVFSFHFHPAVENAGFVAWLSSHLHAQCSAPVIVLCGFNANRGGVYDYWGVPANRTEAVLRVLSELRSRGLSGAASH